MKLSAKSRELQPKGHGSLIFVQNKLAAVAIFLLIIILDQGTKWIVVHRGLNYFCNINGPFGLGSHFSLVSAVVLAILAILFKLEKNEQLKSAFLFILAAGFSNFLDRLLSGCVRDFINLGFWPAFNFADLIITIGAVYIIYRKSKEYFR